MEIGWDVPLSRGVGLWGVVGSLRAGLLVWCHCWWIGAVAVLLFFDEFVEGAHCLVVQGISDSAIPVRWIVMGYRVVRFVAGIVAAGIVSICLYFFAHNVFGFTNEGITLDSLTVAGLVCLMWCAQEMHARYGK